jgi:predicted nucleic acid-binding protein
MKVYLDTCSLIRPVDDKSNLRVLLESEAVLAVLALCESGGLDLLSSEVLAFEVNRTPHPHRKAFVSSILRKASSVVTLSDEIELRAEVLEHRGFKAVDSLHIASAEAGGADYFCTCDDRLLKRARQQVDLLVTIVSPLELAGEVL